MASLRFLPSQIVDVLMILSILLLLRQLVHYNLVVTLSETSDPNGIHSTEEDGSIH